MTTEMQMVRAGQTTLAPRSMAEAVTLAEYAAKSGLCAVREPAQALVVLMTGMELGLSPMQSFRGIHVVSGKPVLSADLLVAIVRSSGVCRRWQTIESTPEKCTIETHREGDAEAVRKTWTMEDARRARLDTPVWRSYPAQMLRHRCAADLAREVYPDLALGCYTADEISDGRVSDADVERVTIARDDAPAQLAPPDRFAAFVADLAAADDLGAVRAVYDTYADALGGTSAKPINEAIIARLAACGYHLTAIEAKALIGGTLDAALGLAYDRLAAVGRHADDEDGHGVVADVVRVLRGCGALPKAAKTRLLKVAALTVAALLDVDVDTAAARLDAALRPPTPPTGTDAPRSTPTADATGSANDSGPAAGAQASVRTVLDADEVEARILRDDATGTATWAEHLAAHAGDQWALAIGFTKRVAAMKAAGVYDTRRKATLDAMERCPAFADRGHADLFLAGREKPRIKAPGAGEVIDLRNRDARANLAAQRTGTDG